MRSTFATRLTTLFTVGWHPRPHPVVSRLVWQQANERRFFRDTSVGVGSSSDPSRDEEDLLRWERMFTEGISAKSTSLSIEPSEKVSIRNKVHVVTYDLDNTLWNTSATISAANDALATHMETLVCSKDAATTTDLNVTRVEKCMNALFKANPENYGPTVTTSTPVKSPVQLTALRKEAIRRVLLDEAGYSDNDVQLDRAVEEAFGIWANARHSSIPTHFATSVLDSLRAIRESTDVVAIGAITDGNSDPMAVPELQGYFDFCVNAETVGIGKPDRRVYQRAVDHVMEHFPLLRSKISAWSDDDDNEVDLVGPWWVHVGDDFVKDVVAAKNFGMRSIWSRELVLGRLNAEATATGRSPKRDLESFVKEISTMDVVKMQIGADDYLAESIQNEFADAIVDRFLDVAATIHQWQRDAEEMRETSGDDQTASISTRHIESLITSVQDESSAGPKTESKFCLFCGATLPQVARFCSVCGKEQM